MGVGSIVFEPLLFLVGRGAKDTMIVQIIGNPALIHTRQKHGKNAFDYFGGLRVNQQGVLIAGVFHISIRSIRADKLTVAARGNPERVNENTIYEIKAELKNRLVSDIKKKKDAEIEEYRVREELMLKDRQEESEEYMKVANKNREIRDCIIREIKACGKKVEKRTRIVCKILFYTLLAAFIVVSIVADVINSGGNVCNGFVVFSLILGTLAVVDGAISKLNYVSRITNKIAYKASAKAMDKEKEKNKQKFNDAINFDDFVTK